MNKRAIYEGILGLLAIWLAAIPSYAEETTNTSLNISAAGVMDNGTTPDGDVAILKIMAMHCGITSADAKDSDKMVECLNKIAKTSNEFVHIQNEAMRQASLTSLEMGLNYKSAAGDYEDTLDEKLDSGVGVQAGSPAAGGEDGATGDDLRKDQTKNIKISSRNAVTMSQLIAVQSDQIWLKAIEAYFLYDAAYRDSKQEDSQ